MRCKGGRIGYIDETIYTEEEKSINELWYKNLSYGKK